MEFSSRDLGSSPEVLFVLMEISSPRDRSNFHPEPGKWIPLCTETLMNCRGISTGAADGIPGQLFRLSPEKTGWQGNWIIYRETDAKASSEPSGQEGPGLGVDVVFRSE